jgi:thioredoxin 1
VNVDENQALSSQLGIQAMPTLLFFKNGQPVDRIVGFTPKKELQARLNAILG